MTPLLVLLFFSDCVANSISLGGPVILDECVYACAETMKSWNRVDGLRRIAKLDITRHWLAAYNLAKAQEHSGPVSILLP